jgi:hypothetical protein
MNTDWLNRTAGASSSGSSTSATPCSNARTSASRTLRTRMDAASSPRIAAATVSESNVRRSSSAKNTSGGHALRLCSRMRYTASSWSIAISSAGRLCLCARTVRSTHVSRNSGVSPSLRTNSSTSAVAAAPSSHFFTSNESSSNWMPFHERSPATLTLGHSPLGFMNATAAPAAAARSLPRDVRRDARADGAANSRDPGTSARHATDRVRARGIARDATVDDDIASASSARRAECAGVWVERAREGVHECGFVKKRTTT